MNPREFIEKNIKQQLQKKGYAENQIIEAVKDGLWYYDNTAIFKKGRCFDECLKHAELSAKRIKDRSGKSKNGVK